MKKIICFILLLALSVLSVSALAEGARIGMLTIIGVTEDDTELWSEKSEEAGIKEAMYVTKNRDVFFDNLQSMLLALTSGEIDCIGIVSNAANYIVERNEGLVATLQDLDMQIGFSIAMREENSERIEGFDTAIAAMKGDGTLDALKAQYIDALGASDPEPVALPAVEGADTIRIAVTGDMPPMDVILADGTPAGFNTAFLAELSRRVGVNFELVSIESSARATALASGVVDALFWTRDVYDQNGELVIYPVDYMEGVAISAPFLMDVAAIVSHEP